jgi:hypothetical protein
MAWQNFGNLAAGNQNLSLFDTLAGQIAKCVLVPCTAANANAIVLTGTANAPAVASYSDLVTFAFVAAANSTSSVTIQFGALAALPAYLADGITQAASGSLTAGHFYTATWNQALNGGAGGFFLGSFTLPVISGTQQTRQVFLSGSSLTYTTPALCKQLFVRMTGGGGSGGQQDSGLSGNAGTATIFGPVTANPGGGGTAGSAATGGLGGSGGAGGAGSSTGIVRIPGGDGATGLGGALAGAVTMNFCGGNGGNSAFGGGGRGNPTGGAGSDPGATNSGAGGGGNGRSSSGTVSSGGGGGAGEYVEFLINSPVATYTYTVGNGGTPPGGGTGAGAAGIIIVDERY